MKNKMVKALVLASVVSVTATGLAGVAYAGDTTALAAGSEKKTEDKKTVDELAKKVKDADKAVTDTKAAYTEKKTAYKTAEDKQKAAEDKLKADETELKELNDTKIAEAYEALREAENDADERRSRVIDKLLDPTTHEPKASEVNAFNAINAVFSSMENYINTRDEGLRDLGILKEGQLMPFHQEPSPEPSTEPEAEPSPEPSTEPEAEPSPEPSPEPSTEPEAEPSPEPSTEPEAEPSPEPSTEPEAEPSPEPSTEPEAEPSPEPSPEPSTEPEAEPEASPEQGGAPATTEDPVAEAKAVYEEALENAAKYETDEMLKAAISKENTKREAFEALLEKREELIAAIGTEEKPGPDAKAVDDAKNAVATAKTAYDDAKTAYEKVLDDLTAAKAAYDKAVKNTTVVYRLYNKVTREHLYSTSALEKKILVEGGWIDENYAWIAPKKSDDTIPVYRLYNKNTTDHHYTTDENEVKELVKRGDWTNDGPVFYAVKEGPVDVLRICNPNLPIGMHLFTTDKNEYETLYIKGWGVKEGNAFDVIATHDAYIEKTTNDPEKLDKELKAADKEVNATENTEGKG
uniref:hypothetical protein n=1 Tax=Eubacterium cellulosolvens TaxID=29322 RepID=UPI000685FED0|nr:hypothetical protein [[Eubacterium] cellulosolvens]